MVVIFFSQPCFSKWGCVFYSLLFSNTPRARYAIVHRQSNKVLDSRSTQSPGTVNFNQGTGVSYQQWIFRQAGSYYTIENSATGLYLDGNGRVSNIIEVMIMVNVKFVLNKCDYLGYL